MGYYDNVKENVKEQAASNSSGSSGNSGGNFDTLKKAASESEPDEEKGDDTPIEVLEEDGLSRNPKRNETEQNSESEERSEGQNPFNSSDSSGSASAEVDMSGVEDKLDTIIEQNQELIKILKSFAQ